MTDDDSATLADVLATTPELPRPERAAAAAWARPLGRDVARALRECSSYGWLRALALELDQALALLRFGERVSLSIPERAWADDYMRKNPAPPNEARLAAVARSKSTDPAERAAARAWIEADQREERLIAEAIADEREVLDEPDALTQSGLWGAVGGNAFRRVSKAGAERIIAEGRKLEGARRGR